MPEGLLRPAGPANVLTTPAELTLRIRWLSVSAIYRLPALSIARFPGSENRALLPVPSASPALPLNPAIVLTTPAEEILRNTWFLESATYTFPFESTATPDGPLNRADAPVPSAVPGPPAEPASVDTTPAEVILRILQFSLSAR